MEELEVEMHSTAAAPTALTPAADWLDSHVKHGNNCKTAKQSGDEEKTETKKNKKRDE